MIRAGTAMVANKARMAQAPAYHYAFKIIPRLRTPRHARRKPIGRPMYACDRPTHTFCSIFLLASQTFWRIVAVRIEVAARRACRNGSRHCRYSADSPGDVSQSLAICDRRHGGDY